MRIEVIIEGYRLSLTESQHWLLVNLQATFMESVDGAAELDLALGPAGRGLKDLLMGGEQAEVGSRLILDVTYAEAHSIYSLLISAPSLFSNEEAFYERVGAFRENLAAMAMSLFKAVQGVNK